MPIRVTCGCGKSFQVKDEFAGKKGKCAACGKIVVIPLAKKGGGSPARTTPKAPRPSDDFALGSDDGPAEASSLAASPRATPKSGGNKLLIYGGAGVVVLSLLLGVGYLMFFNNEPTGPVQVAQNSPKGAADDAAAQLLAAQKKEAERLLEEAKQKATKDEEAQREKDEAKKKVDQEAKLKLEAEQKKVAAYRQREQEALQLLGLKAIVNVVTVDDSALDAVEEAKKLANETYSKHGGGADGLRKAATAVAVKWPNAVLVSAPTKNPLIDELALKLGMCERRETPNKDDPKTELHHFGWLGFFTQDDQVFLVQVICSKAEDPVSERKPFVVQERPGGVSIQEVAHASLKQPANASQVFLTQAPVAARFVDKAVRWKGKIKEVTRKNDLVIIVTIATGKNSGGFASTYDAQLIPKNKDEKVPDVGTEVGIEGKIGGGCMLQNLVNLKTGDITFRYLIAVELTRFVDPKDVAADKTPD